jgi:hypothetical protein
MVLAKGEPPQSNPALVTLSNALAFLDVVRKQPVWDKQKITELFGLSDPEDPSPPTPPEWLGRSPLNPNLLQPYLDQLRAGRAGFRPFSGTAGLATSPRWPPALQKILAPGSLGGVLGRETGMGPVHLGNVRS